MNIGVNVSIWYIVAATKYFLEEKQSVEYINRSVPSFKKIRRDEIEHGTWWFARVAFMEDAWARNCCWLSIRSTLQAWSVMILK